MKFFGRERQLEDLKALWGKRVSSLCTCRGRRRIGKSTLIEQFARISNARFIKIEGVRPKEGYANEDELSAFAIQLAAQTGTEDTVPKNWLSAFVRLDKEIRDNEKTVVLIDKVSWFGYYDQMFSDMVKIAWDNYWKKHDRLIVVLCGSISGWIKENFIDNGAFYGRRSLDMIVGELPLSQCVKFWGASAGVQIDLLIQTRRALYIVEIKRQREIDREVEREVEQKVKRIGKHEGKSIRTSLVFEGHLAPIVEADDFFDSIVPVQDLMGLPH